MAEHFLQRTALAFCQYQIKRGLLVAEVLGWFSDIVRITESSDWDNLPVQLRHATAQEPDNDVAVSVKRVIDSRLSTSLTLGGISRDVGASVRKVTGSFRSHYGMTVHAYIERRRVAQALALLITSKVKLAAIALEIGVSDKATVHRLFRRVVDVTPGDVRRNPKLALDLLRVLNHMCAGLMTEASLERVPKSECR